MHMALYSINAYCGVWMDPVNIKYDTNVILWHKAYFWTITKMALD